MTDPTITLGGTTYSIPPLAIKQNRHVEVLAARHVDYFSRLSLAGGGANLLDVTEAEATDFTLIVYHALTRAYPELTLAQFEQMPISMKEVLLALPVCLTQSGLFRPATEAAPPTGEGRSPSTGMA